MASFWSVVVTEEYMRHLYRSGKTECHKCGIEIKVGDIIIRKKKHGGRTHPYHEACYERLYQ